MIPDPLLLESERFEEQQNHQKAVWKIKRKGKHEHLINDSAG
jgi:hypothetical protein